MTLGEAIAQYRREHGLSQRQFANMTGLSNSYISLIERNHNPTTGKAPTPTISNLQRIAQAMGITMHDLFAVIDDMPVELQGVAATDAPTPAATSAQSPEEERILAIMRQLNPDGQARLIEQAEFFAGKDEYKIFYTTGVADGSQVV